MKRTQSPTEAASTHSENWLVCCRRLRSHPGGRRPARRGGRRPRGGRGAARRRANGADGAATRLDDRVDAHGASRRRGDTLGGIARRYNTTMAAIQRANDMGARTTVRLDERLRIPRSGEPQAPAAPRIVTHRVVRGDTLIGLASRYKTTVSAIQDASGLGRRTDIRIGERLRIPAR